jgi:hypothetical protein
MFHVPAVLVLKFECSWSEHLIDDEWPLPRGRELMPILVALNSSEHLVTNLELSVVHVALVLAVQSLLVSSRV